MNNLSKMFKCEKCNYETSDKSNYGRHLVSKRHLGENATEATETATAMATEPKALTPYQIEKIQLEKEKLQLKKERDELKQKEKEEKELLKKEKELQKQKENEEKETKDLLKKEKDIQKQKDKELKEQKDLLRLQKQKEKNEIELKKIQIQKEKMDVKKQKEIDAEQKRVNEELAKQIQLEEENRIIDYYNLDFETIMNEIKHKFIIYKELNSNNANFYSKFINEVFKINKFKCVRVDKTLQLYLDDLPYEPPTQQDLIEYSSTNNYKALNKFARSMYQTYIKCEIFTNNEWIDTIDGKPITVLQIYEDFKKLFINYNEYDTYQDLFERADSDNFNNTNKVIKMKHIARILSSCLEGTNYFEKKVEDDRIKKERYDDSIIQKRQDQEYRDRQLQEDRLRNIEKQKRDQEAEDTRLDLEARTVDREYRRELYKQVKAERRKRSSKKSNETDLETESEEENEIIEFV